MQGKEILKTQEKFYLADTALRCRALGCSGEIGFVAVRQNKKLYVHVTQHIEMERTEKREYERPLEIRDNYPKYVLCTDEFAGGNYQGIKTMHVADSLLSAEY